MSTLQVANLFLESTSSTGLQYSAANTLLIKAGNSQHIITTDQEVDMNLSAISGGQISGHRNCIINGAMQVDERNDGASVTYTAGAALSYKIDRWYGYCTGGNVTGQQVAGSGATAYQYRFTGAASVTGIGFGQRIESINSYYLAGSTATLSVDLSNSLLTSVTWTAYYANSTDTFGTLASPTRTQIATGTFTVTSTVTRYSAQISIPAAATTGIEIVFSVGSQTSGTWTISNVQLELGSVTTPYENKLYAFELDQCQRYYEYMQHHLAGSWGVNGSEFIYQTPLRAVMRSAPSSAGSTFSYNQATGGYTTTSGTNSTACGAFASAAGFSRVSCTAYYSSEM